MDKAQGEDNGAKSKIVTTQPTSPHPSISPEMAKMMETLQKLNVTPKADNPEDLTKWMIDFLTSTGALKKEPDTKFAFPAPPEPKDQKPTKTMINHPPKITWFSGTETKAGDTTYELWRHEVKCLMRQSYDKDAILNAVRRSLRGEAGHVAMRLDLDASVEDILQKLDSIYGSVDKKEELLAEFYGSRQREDETVTTWSCRLESIIGKAVDKGLVQRKEVDGMLHSMLWTGLKTSLKDISGHKYDTIKDFDGLRVALRQIESDHLHMEAAKPAKPNTSKSASGQETSLTNPDVEELKGLIHQLATRMDTYESGKQHQQPPWQQNREHWHQQQPPWQQQQLNWQNQPWNQPRGRGRGRGRGQFTGRRNYATNTNQQHETNTSQEIVCWRCGQVGHTKIGCRVRLDHSKKSLNGRKPMPGERP